MSANLPREVTADGPCPPVGTYWRDIYGDTLRITSPEKYTWVGDSFECPWRELFGHLTEAEA